MNRSSNLDADALRQKARLRVAAERELRDIAKLPLHKFDSADAVIDAAKNRIEARRKVLNLCSIEPGHTVASHSCIDSNNFAPVSTKVVA